MSAVPTQRQVGADDEEPLQGKFEPLQRKGSELDPALREATP
jgi:hypothetical protein